MGNSPKEQYRLSRGTRNRDSIFARIVDFLTETERCPACGGRGKLVEVFRHHTKFGYWTHPSDIILSKKGREVVRKFAIK